jgi:hypothetical protein
VSIKFTISTWVNVTLRKFLSENQTCNESSLQLPLTRQPLQDFNKKEKKQDDRNQLQRHGNHIQMNLWENLTQELMLLR